MPVKFKRLPSDPEFRKLLNELGGVPIPESPDLLLKPGWGRRIGLALLLILAGILFYFGDFAFLTDLARAGL